MKILMAILNFVATISLGLLVIRGYFMINKIWSRKHEQVVSESISIFAELLALATAVCLGLKAVLDGDVIDTVNFSLEIGIAVLFFLIGVGYWVKTEGRSLGLWERIRRAIRLEGREAGDLFSAFLKPKGADKILKILHLLAIADKKLDAREKLFISRFAVQWDLVYIPQKEMAAESADENLTWMRLRGAIQDYLAVQPPTEQVHQLLDIMENLVGIDQAVSDHERRILGDLRVMLEAYAKGQPISPYNYLVVVVPQSPQQREDVRVLIPQAKPIKAFGGEAFVAGEFHSQAYADMVRSRLRDLEIFTTVEAVKRKTGADGEKDSSDTLPAAPKAVS